MLKTFTSQYHAHRSLNCLQLNVRSEHYPMLVVPYMPREPFDHVLGQPT